MHNEMKKTFVLKVSMSIVNAPLVSLVSKNTNNTKSEVRFNQLYQSCNPWCVHSSTSLWRISFGETADHFYDNVDRTSDEKYHTSVLYQIKRLDWEYYSN
jgi:hypothetical protein